MGAYRASVWIGDGTVAVRREFEVTGDRDLLLELPGSNLTGRVLDPDGVPVIGGRVEAAQRGIRSSGWGSVWMCVVWLVW